MSIETECPKCGKAYRVKDEMAGKKFRCKSCQSAVMIPAAGSAEDDEWDEDFLGGLDSAVKSERRTAAAPPPIASGRTPRSKSKSKKSKQNAGGSEGLASALKVIGGLLGGGVGFVIGYVVVRALISGGGVGGEADWQSFTPVAGTYQVEMPGLAEPNTVEGRTVYVTEILGFSCGVSAEPVPEGEERPPQQLLEEAAGRYRIPVAAATTSERTMQFGDAAARELEITLDASSRTLQKTWRFVIADGVLYILECVTPGAAGSADRDRFFNSFQLLEAAGQPREGSWDT